MGLAMALFAPQIIGWFSSGDPELVRLGTLCIRLQALALPIHAWVAIVNHLAGGLGKAKIARLLATAIQGSCFILFEVTRRDYHNRGTRPVTNACNNFVTVHIRQAQVQQNTVRAMRRNDR